MSKSDSPIPVLTSQGIPEGELLDALNREHIAVLAEKLPAGVKLHAGLARHGRGGPLCDDLSVFPEQFGALRSPYFAMKLPEKQRLWCAIVWLEGNRGCQHCIAGLYAIADVQGWKQPRRLMDLLTAA